MLSTAIIQLEKASYNIGSSLAKKPYGAKPGAAKKPLLAATPIAIQTAYESVPRQKSEDNVRRFKSARLKGTFLIEKRLGNYLRNS